MPFRKSTITFGGFFPSGKTERLAVWDAPVFPLLECESYALVRRPRKSGNANPSQKGSAYERFTKYLPKPEHFVKRTSSLCDWISTGWWYVLRSGLSPLESCRRAFLQVQSSR